LNFYINLLLSVVFLFVAILFVARIFGYLFTYFFWGAIYVPTREDKVKKIIEFLDIKPGQKIVDLGSGDGRLVIALAKAGAIAYGYEINPFLVARAKKSILAAGLGDEAFVYCKNLWKQDLSCFDAVVVFGMKHMMKKLELKVKSELKVGSKVVSNYFTFPTWVSDRAEEEVYLYVKNIDKEVKSDIFNVSQQDE